MSRWRRRAALIVAVGVGVRMGARLVRETAEVETPAGFEVVRVDERCIVPDDATEVQGGERRPVGAVTETVVRDAPQRFAGPHHVGRGRGGASGRDVTTPCALVVSAVGEDAPATEDTARGPPIDDSARTPTAMRAATWSMTEAPRRLTSPRRTWVTTPRRSWRQQAAHATQAASVSGVSASRASGLHA